VVRLITMAGGIVGGSLVPEVQVWWRVWELDWTRLGLIGVRDVTLRVTVAMRSRLNCLRVHVGVYERHSLEHEYERISGWGNGAMRRAMVRNVGRCVR
jgi:hypothetical protein